MKQSKLEEVTNFTVEDTREYGSGEILGHAIVTEVNQETKTITLETDLPPLKPGDEGYCDPVALEQQLVAEEQARLSNHNDEEIACMALKLYTPRFNALVDKLSTRALRRMVKALQEFPLGDHYAPKEDSAEAQAFAIGRMLKDAQTVLIVKTYYDNKDKIEEMAKEAALSATMEFQHGDQAQQSKEVTNNG